MDMHAAEYQSVARSKTEAFRNVTASKHFFFFFCFIYAMRGERSVKKKSFSKDWLLKNTKTLKKRPKSCFKKQEGLEDDFCGRP